MVWKKQPIVARARAKRSLRLLAAAIASVAMFSAVLMAVSPASAAEIDAIDDVQIQGTPPSTVGDQFRLDATWSIPDGGAVRGDSFRLDFPDDVEGFDSTFVLRDAAGAAVGDCTVDAGGITCVFSDYVETHQGVHGSLFFYAKASAEKTDGEYVFTDDSGFEYRVPVPGPIGPRGEGSKPNHETLDKSGNVWTPGGDINWRLAFAARHLLTPDGHPIVLTDTYDTRLTYRDDLSVSIWEGGLPSQGGHWTAFPQDIRGGAAGTFWVESDPATHSFQFGINGLETLDPAAQFLVNYSTGVPEGTVDGMSFSNSISGAGITTDVATVRYRGAGGTGGGDAVYGRIEVHKKDSVSGGSLAGAEFEVRQGGVKVATLGPTDAAGAATTGDLAPGDYELIETVAPRGHELDATPVPVTITAAGGTVSVTVENDPIVVTPPTDETTPPTDETTPPGDDATPAHPNPSVPKGQLASTGGDLGLLPAGGGALLLLLGLALMLMRRRRSGDAHSQVSAAE